MLLVAHHRHGKTQPAGPPLSWKNEPPSLHTFSGKTIKRAYLAAAYRNGLSCLCVLELYFDVDWHGVALLFLFMFLRRSETERFDCAGCEHLLFQTPVFSLG